MKTMLATLTLLLGISMLSIQAAEKEFFGKWNPPASLAGFWDGLDERWWNPANNSQIAKYCKRYATKSDRQLLLKDIFRDLKGNPSVERTFVYSLLVIKWDRKKTMPLLNRYYNSGDADLHKIATDFIADIEDADASKAK